MPNNADYYVSRIGKKEKSPLVSNHDNDNIQNENNEDDGDEWDQYNHHSSFIVIVN